MLVNSRDRWGEMPRAEGGASEERRGRNLPVPIVVGLIALVLVGFAVYIRASGNTAAIEANGRRLDALEASAGRAGEEASPAAIATLEKRVAALERELQRLKGGRRAGAASGFGALSTSPGGYPPQRLQPPPGSGAEELLAPDQGSLDVPNATEGSLPRYERRISPDGKLILRKIQ